jgi:hypothetical protein
VRVYRGEQAPVAPPRTACVVQSRGRAEEDVASVVVMNERDEGNRDENDAVQHPSGCELRRGFPVHEHAKWTRIHTHEVFPSGQTRRHEHTPHDEPGEKDPIGPEHARQREPDRRTEPPRACTCPHALV